MKHRIRSLMLLVIAVILLITASACALFQPGTPDEVDTPKPADNDVPETDPMAKYDPPIDAHFGSVIDPNHENIIKLKEQAGETIEDNRWTRLFHEQIGVNIVYDLMAGWGEYSPKLKMAMAAGDLPDFFTVLDMADVEHLVQAGAIEDIGPYYERYASPLLRSIIEMEGTAIFDPVTFDGKIYGLPRKMPSTNGYNHLWVRQDWLDKLNLERPKTMKDVINIARTFVNEDPNETGTRDTFGMMLQKDFLWPTQGFFWGYGAYPLTWIRGNDGKVVRGAVQPEMKEPLRALNLMYTEGLIDKEFIVQDGEKAFETMVAGRVGMFYGPHWEAFQVEDNVNEDPDAHWVVVPLPTEGGRQIRVPLTNAFDGVVVVRKGAANPEALVKIFNVYVEALFGETAKFSYFFGEKGIDGIWMMAPIYTLDPMIDLRAHQEVKFAVENNTTDQLEGVAKGFFQNMEQGMLPFSLMFGPYDSAFAFVDATYPDQIFWNAYFGPPTPTMVERWSSMEELLTTTFTQMIQGIIDIDTGFDTMVNDWMNMGGSTILEEINAKVGN